MFIMARVFSFAEFDEALEKKFGSLVIGDVTFRAHLSLSDDEMDEYAKETDVLTAMYKASEAHQNLVERLDKEEKEAEGAESEPEGLQSLRDQVEASAGALPTVRTLADQTLKLIRITTVNKAEFDTMTEGWPASKVYTLLGLYSDGTQAGEA
jgi:dihydroorotate dehydrogenase